MKTFKYLIFLLAAAFAATGCYDDKGSYNTDPWTDIVSVEGMTLPGIESMYMLSLIEDETFSLDPTVLLRKDADESSFTYDWVLGRDTIASGLKLDWRVTRTEKMEFSATGEAYFWLAINNTATGENWRYYLRGNNNSMLKVKIVPTMTPKIGIFVYEKPDGTIEWGSVKGGNPASPAAFTTLYTDLYTRYNTSRKIEGSVAGATFSGSHLIVYTNRAPDYGAFVQASETGTYALGLFMGTVSNEVFQGEPDAAIAGQTFYKGAMQEILIGNSLFIAPTSGAYQMILPNAVPTQDRVAQIMGANPYTDIMHFSVQRTLENEIYYYRYNENKGYLRQPLPDENGATLKADRIIGVCRQPTFLAKQLKMFVTVKTGAAYWLYTYTYEQKDSGNDTITFVGKTDITNWTGGMSDDCEIFTNAVEVPLNYLYIAKGRDLWRTSYESQTAPQIAKSFPAPITTAKVVTNLAKPETAANEIYTAVFTYDESTKTSKMYVLDGKAADLKAFSEVETPIPGKAVRYLPYL